MLGYAIPLALLAVFSLFFSSDHNDNFSLPNFLAMFFGLAALGSAIGKGTTHLPQIIACAVLAIGAYAIIPRRGAPAQTPAQKSFAHWPMWASIAVLIVGVAFVAGVL